MFDKASQPYATAQDLADAFGISKSTAGSKSKQVRDWLKISYFSHQWTLPSKLADSPMAWMISLDGFIVDARHLPRHIQEEAYRKGVIPSSQNNLSYNACLLTGHYPTYPLL